MTRGKDLQEQLPVCLCSPALRRLCDREEPWTLGLECLLLLLSTQWPGAAQPGSWQPFPLCVSNAQCLAWSPAYYLRCLRSGDHPIKDTPHAAPTAKGTVDAGTDGARCLPAFNFGGKVRMVTVADTLTSLPSGRAGAQRNGDTDTGTLPCDGLGS